ncbi:thioredoxin domain-containing protein [Candidatus Micrarchaeota archaeon]|nr:thioredoxin domain-containing protein [Candidatus Micrarchaeota archaeon]
MVLCFIALIVFAVMGLFSAKYRPLAKAAFDCTIRKATLRPCDSGLDAQIRAGVLSGTMRFSPRIARGVNKNFALLSSLLTIVFFASLFYSAFSVYNFYAYGNCNGPNSSGWCVFNALSGSGGGGGNGLVINPVIGSAPVLGNSSANVTVIEFGCFSCPYTKSSEADRKKFVERNNASIQFAFKAFPLPNHRFSWELAESSYCALDQSKYWQFHDLLFANQEKIKSDSTNESIYGDLAALSASIGLNESKFLDCLQSRKYYSTVAAVFDEGVKAGLHGTPTFFINNVSLTGPQSNADLTTALHLAQSGQAFNATSIAAGVCLPDDFNQGTFLP